MLKQDKVLKIFRITGALLRGHFRLTSGLHSGHYLQCARVLQYPKYAKLLCKEMAKPFVKSGITVVAGPAMGGLIVSYEVACALKARSVFAEREDNEMTFRRGFCLNSKDKVLVVEDVMTTGGSIKEVVNLVKNSRAKLEGVSVIVNRSANKVDFGVKFHSLLNVNIETFPPDKCPLCEEKIALTKPGSRKV